MQKQMNKKELVEWLEEQRNIHAYNAKELNEKVEKDLTKLSDSGLLDNLANELNAEAETKLAAAFELCRRYVERLKGVK